MIKRRLKRQLNLAQVVMLGTAGAIGAQMFLLTGHGAGMAGSAFILAILIGGLLSFSIALNYGELATCFPETGGAMTYVREAWGKGLLSYLVGSLDCLSSVFFAGLSAIGFAYSLQIFFPVLPIIPTAFGIIVVFTILNILGVSNVGNTQIILGVILLLILFAYVVLGFVLPEGFHWSTYLSGGKFFIHEGGWSNLYWLLSATALSYIAYIGYEVIADDAEEVKNPDRNLPFGILLSLILCFILFPLITLVTLGTLPWNELAGSDVALTSAAGHFLPGIGLIALGIAGLIATVTTLNSSMLSATREAFTLSRDGAWPYFLSKLSKLRTPYIASLVIGLLCCFIAAIGVVEFLSYISASGYLFVLFWSNLALIRLRKRYPDLRRPFKVPLYPLTVYLAMGTCVLILAFTQRQALLFGAGLIAFLTVLYYVVPVLVNFFIKRVQKVEKLKNRILVPVSNPQTGVSLVHMAAIMAQNLEDTSICVFHVTHLNGKKQLPSKLLNDRAVALPDQILMEVRSRNVPLYKKIVQNECISAAILEEIESQKNVKLLLAGWPGLLVEGRSNLVQELLEKAETNLAVFLPHHLGKIRSILVPLHGGLHSRLALHLAYEIGEQENARITVFQVYSQSCDAEEVQDKLNQLGQIVTEEFGAVPPRISTRVAPGTTVVSGITHEIKRQPYDLLVMGASEEYGEGLQLFGNIDDWIMENVQNCSVLLARRYEPVVIHWIQRYLKRIEKQEN